MTEREFEALCDDIREHGIIVPLCVTENSLDHHRGKLLFVI